MQCDKLMYCMKYREICRVDYELVLTSQVCLACLTLMICEMGGKWP